MEYFRDISKKKVMKRNTVPVKFDPTCESLLEKYLKKRRPFVKLNRYVNSQN